MQVIRSGVTSMRVTVDLTSSDGTATQKGDYTNAVSRIIFEPGVTQKTIPILVCEDSYGEGPESFTLTLSNPTGGSTLGGTATTTIQIADDASEPAGNPIDVARTFVCQHYHDFLARPSDSAGEDFWTNEITSCGTDPGCIEQKRINVSAAFFLSIEFQQTGYFVIRAQKSAFGSAKSNPRYLVFLRDQRQIGEGVVIGQPGADALLEQNKQAYVVELVDACRFRHAIPIGLGCRRLCRQALRERGRGARQRPSEMRPSVPTVAVIRRDARRLSAASSKAIPSTRNTTTPPLC